jgi:hypothetical protein
MSVVIGYVTDQFSIIMTDTRITYGKNAEYGWDDNYEKLVSIPRMGWATGVGVCDFIENFNKILSRVAFGTVGKLEEIYVNTLEKEKQKNECPLDHIDSTVITCSWLDKEDNRKRCKVGLFCNEHFGKNLKELVQHQINILYPFDYLDDINKVEAIEKRYSKIEECDGNLEKLMEHLLLIFAEISANSFSVSSICDIGIHLLKNNDVCKLKLKEEIRPLIKAAQNGTIMNMLSVVD